MARTGKILGKAELLNIQGISPLVSKVDVKVLYIGENRHRYDIGEETAIKLVSRIRCLPIVGHFIPEKNDFGGHDVQVSKEGHSFVEKEMTIPYGFVAENAKIWKQDFEELDENHNSVIRTYFMTEGYIWTGVYPESARILLGKNNQSMELDADTICGEWAINPNSGVEFLILDDATLTKLCILGEDVEPCFEGANIVPSTNFSLNEEEEDLITNFMLVFSKHLKGVNKSMENKENKEEKTTKEEKEEKEEKENKKDEKEEKKEEKNTDKKDEKKEEEKENKEEKEDKKDEKKEEEKEKEIENKKKFSCDDLSEVLKGITNSLKDFSCRLDKIEKNTKTEEEKEKERENKKKEEMISKFSAMSVSEMEKTLGEKEEEPEEKNQDKIEKNITTFSIVNGRKPECKENEKVPEYISYIQKFNN